MQENKAIQVLKWSVILLVVCNIGLLLTLWLLPMRPPFHEHELPMNERSESENKHPWDLNERLSFTKEQEDKFEHIREENQKRVDSIKTATIAIRQQFFDCLKEGISTKQKSDSLAMTLGKMHEQLEMQTYSFFGAIREICTDSQKVVFDGMIGNILRTMPEQPHVKGDTTERPHDGERGMRPPPHRHGDRPPPPPNGERPPPPRDGPPPR